MQGVTELLCKVKETASYAPLHTFLGKFHQSHNPSSHTCSVQQQARFLSLILLRIYFWYVSNLSLSILKRKKKISPNKNYCMFQSRKSSTQMQEDISLQRDETIEMVSEVYLFPLALRLIVV